MEIRIAKPTEFQEVRVFYHKVIDLMREAKYKPAWEKDVYPSNAYLKKSIENGELWICETEDGCAAAMIINHEHNEGYEHIKWSVEAENNEVITIHALCVLPAFQGKGIAGAMIRKVIELAGASKRKAIRLDVLDGNLPAEKLYLKHGFKYVDTVKMFYEDTGWTEFKLFEYTDI